MYSYISLSLISFLPTAFHPSLPSFTSPSPSFPNLSPSIHPSPLSSHSFYSESKITVAVNGLFNNTNQLKFCLVQDSEPSTEQVAHVKSKNKSPTSVLGLPLLRHPEKLKKNFLFIPFSFYLFKAEHTVKFRK